MQHVLLELIGEQQKISEGIDKGGANSRCVLCMPEWVKFKLHRRQLKLGD